MFKVILLNLITWTAVISATCPNGWLTHGGMCYLFSHGREDWPGSYEMCKIMGGQLVEIESLAENDYLKLQATSSNYYWIGLTDASEEGTWTWMTSQTTINTHHFSKWYPGEPSRYADTEPENCVEMYSHYDGKWNDAPCTQIHHYICEKSPETVEIIG